MWTTIKTTAALSAVLAAATTSAIKVDIINQCANDLVLSHLGAGTIISVEPFPSGNTITKQIPMGSASQLFKAGTGAQATLAEITVMAGKVWADLSIIPTGTVGPGNCASFDECKRVTGGNSFNYPMQIVPSQGSSGSFPTCQTITCMYDGCPEAYLFPDDLKTKVCPPNTDLKVIFCPGGPGGQTPAPTTPAPTTPAPTTPAPTTPAPTTPAPTTPAPTTPAPAATENDALSFKGGFLGAGSNNGTAKIGEDRSLDAGVAQAPTQAPTEAPTTQPVVAAGAPVPAEAVKEANTQSAGSSSGGAGTVMLIVGAAAMVAASAIFVIRKKKKALEEMEQKTPLPTATRATNAFMLTTPQETTVL